MRIDIFSDVVCPWCFIGKRRLETALTAAAIGDADIRWHAFQLNPDLPREGVERRAYLEAKFGPGAAECVHARLREAGAQAGIDFRFEKIERSPNTFDAHRLLWLAGTQGRQNTLAEALFTGYFLEGRDIGDRDTLTAIAAQAGLQHEVQNVFAGDAGVPQVRQDLAEARGLGISGVPFFIFNGRQALAGAQPPEVFAEALAAARRAA